MERKKNKLKGKLLYILNKLKVLLIFDHQIHLLIQNNLIIAFDPIY